MNIKKMLADLATEGAALAKKAAETPDEFTTEDAERADEIVKEHARLKGLLDQQEKVTKSLAGITTSDDDAEDRDPSGEPVGKTVGAQFVSSEAYKGLKTSNPTGIAKGSPINVKTHVSKVLTTELLDPKQPAFTDDLTYRPPRTFLNLITTGTTAESYLPYRQVVSRTNNAAIVAEAKGTTGTTAAEGYKPISDLATQPAEAKVFDYADGMEVTNQELADDGAIQALIDSTLMENLEVLIERMLLHGDGTGLEPRGLFHTTGVLQQDFDTDPAVTLRRAKGKLHKTGTQIQAVVLSPEDDEEWDLMKDNSGRYLGAGPFASGPNTAWSIPRIVSTALEPGQFVMGDFRTIHFLIRQALAIEAFNQHKDFAQRNLVYVRAELRAMQLLRAPARLLIGSLSAGSEG